MYKELSAVKAKGVTVESETIYKLTENAAWFQSTVYGEVEESHIDSDDTEELRKYLLETINDMAFYNCYDYDPATKTYKANKSVCISFLEASTENITISFKDGKLTEIKYDVTFTESEIEYNVVSTMTISDYGAVVIEPAE